MNSSNPPPDQFEPWTGQDLFQFTAGIFLYFIHFVGVFWALIVRKPGTTGSRAYVPDALGGFVLLLALSQNGWEPDRYLFTACLIAFPILFFWHWNRAVNSPKHIHTQCIGASRFRGEGDNPYLLEWVSGLVPGLLFVAAGMAPFGFFIAASASCVFIRQGMIKERDRLRAVQMADAMLEGIHDGELRTMEASAKWVSPTTT